MNTSISNPPSNPAPEHVTPQRSNILTPSTTPNHQQKQHSIPINKQSNNNTSSISPESSSISDNPQKSSRQKRKLSHPMRSASKVAKRADTNKQPTEDATTPCALCQTLLDDARRDKASAEEQLRLMQGKHRDAVAKLEQQTMAITTTTATAQAREMALRNALQQAIIRATLAERTVDTMRAADASMGLGRLSYARAHAYHMAEVWEDGPALQDLAARTASITKQREAVDAARKALRRRLPGPGQGPSKEADLSPEEFVAKEDMFKVRLAALKREEEHCRQEKERLDAEKHMLARELKRLAEQGTSRWNNTPVLHGRYVLGSLLGRGGFSEVYKAFDLDELQFVAVKIHQLNPGWGEAKKQAYVRHAVRECSIHKDLQHPCIVALHDIFEIDAETFATVLELCEGGDLEGYLRDRGTLPEREARTIVSRVLAGLAHLNTTPGRRVIHYDLKPANILFDEVGQVKITDFGLSKIMEEGATQLGTELTSQGAGTYWYLPPECFQLNQHQPPRITNKVDVWSLGVVFYQLLYGKRPFGEGLSQEHILRNNVMLSATEVQFPAKPAVSAEAKEFIVRCLAHRVEERMDVLEAAQHPYMVGGGGRGGGRGKQSPASVVVGGASEDSALFGVGKMVLG